MFKNKFYWYRAEVCPEIEKIIDFMVYAQSVQENGMKRILITIIWHMSKKNVGGS